MNVPVEQWSRSLLVRPTIAVPPDLALRHYRAPGDIDLWLQLRRRAFADSAVEIRPWTATDFQREILAKTWWRRERMWLVESAGAASELLGAVILAKRGAGARAEQAIHWLMVQPEWRRRSFGSLLLAAAEAKAWDLGQRRVVLESHRAWQAAAQLYERRGYTRGASRRSPKNTT